MIGKAGIGTPHMDGNTRWCTATAASAFQESFGSDGQPGSYTDIDTAGAIFLFGHNVAETQTVLWARMLDRLDGADPPRLVCVDPRRTNVVQRATVHLPIRNGTNLALMHALVHEQIRGGYLDEDYVAAHTTGLRELAALIREATPEWAAAICGVPAGDIRRATEIFDTSQRVVSTVSMGFYQSHQATAASCQVNNLHLLRGMLGRPGAGILQMNGQPSAENNREAGCGLALPGFRNWDNPEHVRQLAELWNVDPIVIPHWAPPTDANAIFRYAEQGSIGFLWISGTNPAVSMPDLAAHRRLRPGQASGDRTEPCTVALAAKALPITSVLSARRTVSSLGSRSGCPAVSAPGAPRPHRRPPRPGAGPAITAPQQPQRRSISWCSTTRIAPGGRSNACRRCTPTSSASVRFPPQPLHALARVVLAHRDRAARCSVRPECPGCPPGLRPDRVRSDFGAGLANPSELGGFEEFFDDCPSRPPARRSSPAPRQPCLQLLDQPVRLREPLEQLSDRGEGDTSLAPPITRPNQPATPLRT